MPQSRSRRPRNQSAVSRRRERRRRYDETRALRRGTAADAVARLTSQDRACYRAAADAELRGDPVAALEHCESIPSFQDSLHHQRLRLLAELGDDAPRWLWSRWLTVQARRPLWTGAVTETPDPALVKTLEVAYPHGFDEERMDGWPVDVFLALMNERDWIMRQLVVYEHGTLRHLVDDLAGPRLLERADQVAGWVDAPMGGYRLESDEDRQLWLTDLADGRQVDVLDLGLGHEHWPGTHFLGRIVPTQEPPGRMFEWRPMPVDAVTARRVAERPDAWLDTVAEQARTGKLPVMFSYFDDDTSITADLPVRSWIGLLEREDIDRLPQEDGLIDYLDAALAALPKLLRIAEHAAEHLDVARHVAESLMLEPGLYDAIRERFGGRRFATAWWMLAGAVREPARSRCLRMSATRYDARRPDREGEPA